MAIPLFLAAYPAELAALPKYYAWMAWDLSEDFPERVPRGSMMVVTDRGSPKKTDPEAMAQRLRECSAVLLDFQRPGSGQTYQMAKAIVRDCSIPVGVSEPYARELDCPVFLPPVPPDRSLAQHCGPWSGRELWLDLSPSPTRITVTSAGSRQDPLHTIPSPAHPHRDPTLFCHYGIDTKPDRIHFDLWRTREDLKDLLSAAESFGVTHAIGLYQELGIF